MSELKEIGWFPKEWIVTRFTDLSPDEIEELQEMEDEESGGGGFGGGGVMGGSELPEPEEGMEPDMEPGMEPGMEEGGEEEGEEEFPPPEELEGYDRKRTDNIIMEIDKAKRKAKTMNFVRKIYRNKNRITSPAPHLLETKELDGLSKPKDADAVITEDKDSGVLGAIPDSDEIIVEWSVPESERAEALDEVATILKGSTYVPDDSDTITDNDLPG
jgi:hypothetical protein